MGGRRAIAGLAARVLAVRVLAVLVLPALLAAAPARAAPPAPSVYLEELTWTELREQVRGGATTALVPIGGTEQNGPHMVLGKHNLRVRLLAGRIAQALGGALVAPVMAYVPEGSIDPPSSHMRFAGTLSIAEADFEQVLLATCNSLRRHGFTHIVLLGEHGGYQASLRRVEARVNRQWAGSPARVHAIARYYQAAQVDFAAELQRRGFTREEIGTHAGLLDTSLSLALAPALVRAPLARTQGPAVGEGVYGDPRRATAELGQLGVDIIVRESVQAIRQATQGR